MHSQGPANKPSCEGQQSPQEMVIRTHTRTEEWDAGGKGMQLHSCRTLGCNIIPNRMERRLDVHASSAEKQKPAHLSQSISTNHHQQQQQQLAQQRWLGRHGPWSLAAAQTASSCSLCLACEQRCCCPCLPNRAGVWACCCRRLPPLLPGTLRVFPAPLLVAQQHRQQCQQQKAAQPQHQPHQLLLVVLVLQQLQALTQPR